MPLLKEEVADDERLIEPPVMVSPLVEERPPAPVESIPPAKVEVELLPRIVVVAVPPIPRLPSPVMPTPKEKVEVAVVEVDVRERKVGVTESMILKVWAVPDEEIERFVFWPA
jgi:hypothetical protein